jgi:hypothetical protein
MRSSPFCCQWRVTHQCWLLSAWRCQADTTQMRCTQLLHSQIGKSRRFPDVTTVGRIWQFPSPLRAIWQQADDVWRFIDVCFPLCFNNRLCFSRNGGINTGDNNADVMIFTKILQKNNNLALWGQSCEFHNLLLTLLPVYIITGITLRSPSYPNISPSYDCLHIKNKMYFPQNTKTRHNCFKPLVRTVLSCKRNCDA